MIDSMIKKWEGCKLKAYKDGGGVWTIGWGHTKGVKENDTCTQEQADEWLQQESNEVAFGILSVTQVPLSENQLTALVSFVYNVGLTAYINSTLLKMLNQSNYQGAADQLLRWCKDNGKEVKGLLNRRKDERELFLS